MNPYYLHIKIRKALIKQYPDCFNYKNIILICSIMFVKYSITFSWNAPEAVKLLISY